MARSAFSRFTILFSLSLSCASWAHATPGVVVATPQGFPPLQASDVLEPGDHLPVLVAKVDPAYPGVLMDSARNDRVYVAFVVDNTGAVKKPRAIFGNLAECEQAAVEAVAAWKFQPGVHMGKPVSTQMTVEIRFVADVDAASPAD